MGGLYPPYPQGPFARKFAIGGAGGKNFLAISRSENGEPTGAVVKRLMIWKTKNALVGIRVWYTNGDFSPVIGSEKGDSEDITFTPGEQVNSLTLWGNGVGTRAGRVFFTTDKNNTFDHGKNTSGQASYPAPPASIGSGLMMGVFGRAGGEIDCLGFIFMDYVSKVIINNLRYDTPDLLCEGISTTVLDKTTYRYHGLESTWTFSGRQSRIDTITFSQSATLTYGQSVTIEAGIPEVAKVGSTANWSISCSSGRETSSSVEHEVSWSVSGVIKSAADDVECTAVCYYGVLPKVPYTATVVVHLISGKTFSYEERGYLARTQYTSVEANAVPLGLPKGISGANGIEGGKESALLEEEYTD